MPKNTDWGSDGDLFKGLSYQAVLEQGVLNWLVSSEKSIVV